MLNQVVQVKYSHWRVLAPCFLGVRLCKNFSVRACCQAVCHLLRSRCILTFPIKYVLIAVSFSILPFTI